MDNKNYFLIVPNKKGIHVVVFDLHEDHYVIFFSE
jgi:hypothetical protein